VVIKVQNEGDGDQSRRENSNDTEWEEFSMNEDFWEEQKERKGGTSDEHPAAGKRRGFSKMTVWHT